MHEAKIAKKVEVRQHLEVYRRLGWRVVPLRLTERDGTKFPVFPTKSLRALVETIYSSPDPSSAVWEWVEEGYDDLALVLDGSGILVVDVDDPTEFRKVFGTSPDLYAMEHSIPCVVSGKGVHLYFRAPDRPVSYKQPWGEAKTTGLMFVPPSSHPVSRKKYEWLFPLEMLETNGLPPVPDDLLQKLVVKTNGNGHTTPPSPTTVPSTPKPKKEVDLPRVLDILASYYIRGQRDILWVGLAGLCRRVGLSLEQAEDLCRQVTAHFGDEEANQRLAVIRRTYSLLPYQVASTSWLSEHLNMSSEELRALKTALGFVPFVHLTPDNVELVISKDAVEQYVLNSLSTTVVRLPSGGCYLYDPSRGVWEFSHRKDLLKEKVIHTILAWVSEMTTAAYGTIYDDALRLKVVKKLSSFKRSTFYTDLLFTVLTQLPTELPNQVPEGLLCCPEHGKTRGSLQSIVVTKNAVVFPYLCGCFRVVPKDELPSLRELGATIYCPVVVDTSIQRTQLLDSYFSVWEDDDLVETLLRVASYTVFNRQNPWQKVFVFVGRSGSGKTTFSYLISGLLGNSIVLSGTELATKTHWANLKAVTANKKLAVVEEIPPKVNMAALVKELTNRRVSGRFLYHDFAEFPNLCTYWLVSNHTDLVNDGDEAVAKRLEVVFFPKRISFQMDEGYKKLLDIPADAQDKSIPQAEAVVLSDEDTKTALFTRLLGAWERVCRDGVFVVHQPSKDLKLQLTVQYASVHLFLVQHTETRWWFPVKWLFELYAHWMQTKGLQPVTSKQFQAQIAQLCSYKQRRRIHQLSPHLVEAVRRVLPNLLDGDTSKQVLCYLLNPSLQFLNSLPPSPNGTDGDYTDALSLWDDEDTEEERETTTESQPDGGQHPVQPPVCHVCGDTMSKEGDNSWKCSLHGNRVKSYGTAGLVYFVHFGEPPTHCPLCHGVLDGKECPTCKLTVELGQPEGGEDDDDLDFPF